MKKLFLRLVSLCAVLAILFTFASCGVKDKVTPTDVTDVDERYSSGIEELAINKELEDTKGKVSYQLNLVFPQLSADTFVNSETMNAVYSMRADEMQTFAKNNVENASKFMSENKDAQPWVSTAKYSITYRDADYLCVLCEYGYGMGSDSRSKRLVSDCFLLAEGSQCRLESFFNEGVKAQSVYELLADKVLDKMIDSSGASRLSEGMTRETIIEKYSPTDFYITDSGITFYYQLATIAPYKEGVLEFSFTAEEVQALMTLPMTK